jgi:hypothetical protein
MLAQKNSFYSKLFACKRVSTHSLQNPVYLQQMLDAGFCWIRREEKPFLQTLRNPTVGCIVELFCMPRANAVPLDSPKGIALLRKVCYY